MGVGAPHVARGKRVLAHCVKRDSGSIEQHVVHQLAHFSLEIGSKTQVLTLRSTIKVSVLSNLAVKTPYHTIRGEIDSKKDHTSPTSVVKMICYS